MLMDKFRNNMKLIIYIVVFSFALGGVVMYLNTPGGNSGQKQVHAQRPTDTVASVNGDEILYHEYEQQLNSYLSQHQGQIGANQIVELKNSVLDNIIDQRLILQEADKLGISKDVSEEIVEEQLNQVIEYYASSKEEFEKMLSGHGETLDGVREDIRESLAVQTKIEGVINNVIGDIEISDEELLADSAEVRASHILVRNHDKDDEEAKAIAEEVLTKLEAGEDFGELAKEYSEDGSAANGGDLGFFGRGQMVGPFEEKAFALETGEVSGLVETQFGYHIIKVTDRKDISADEADMEELRKEMLAQREQEKFINWLDGVRDESDIVIEDKEISAFNASLSGDFDQAISEYKEVIRTNPRAYYVYHNLAQIHQRNNNLDEAISTLEEAVEKYPDHIEFYTNLAQIYQRGGEADKAINLYEDALENDGNNPELRLALGELYNSEGEVDKAIAQFEIFSELAEGDLMAQYRLATIYSQMGLEDKAQEQMEKIEQIQNRGNEEVVN
ncbi:peptidylprolyl isomerase [Halonatronum saccharophilum]|uniref:peptidylprolyl isomerase n=1 Tax=Halonatronum saccharophilum TaxID=150060 RepID=UPI0004BB1AC2|nr:peptidylprolyl isomerase [Halonatronum saccharophilum]